VGSIGYPSGNGTTKESNCACRTEHEPEFFGPEPSSRKKGRQERGGGTERTEKCGIEQNKLKQHAPHEEAISTFSHVPNDLLNTVSRGFVNR
jgi:hypothetical protein